MLNLFRHMFLIPVGPPIGGNHPLSPVAESLRGTLTTMPYPQDLLTEPAT